MVHRRLIPILPLIVLIGIAASDIAEGQAGVTILPQPQHVESAGGGLLLAATGEGLAVRWPTPAGGAISEGRELLAKRLMGLNSHAENATESPVLLLEIASRQAFRRHFTRKGLEAPAGEDVLKQAYYIRATGGAEGAAVVTIQAVAPLGLYYGINTFCQILRQDEAGGIVSPAVEILDYPSIPFRLSKSSASRDPLEGNVHLTRWLPALKISHIGLQYHGDHSKRPEPPFKAAISTLCADSRRRGVLESIVYFCPYRGQQNPDGTWTSYDMQSKEDREAYAERLLWFMAQGAGGIEVDYNDWPGSREVPISDIINLAHKAVRKEYPDAHILYCPPNYGDELYRGPASTALVKTLSRVDERVHCLWTGVQTLISAPLTAGDFQAWTSDTGRKPLFWINRASTTAKAPFIRRVNLPETVTVFKGDFLPKSLPDLVTGVHLNSSLQSTYDAETREFDRAELIYMASTSDFLWNPEDWDAEGSARRAVEFVDVMMPLIGE